MMPHQATREQARSEMSQIQTFLTSVLDQGNKIINRPMMIAQRGGTFSLPRTDWLLVQSQEGAEDGGLHRQLI